MYAEYLVQLTKVDWVEVAEASRVAVYAVSKNLMPQEQAAKIVASHFHNPELQGWAEQAFKKSLCTYSELEFVRGRGVLDFMMDDAEDAVSLANAIEEEFWWVDSDAEPYPTDRWRDWVYNTDIPNWVKEVFYNVIDCIEEEEDEKNHSDKE